MTMAMLDEADREPEREAPLEMRGPAGTRAMAKHPTG